MAFYISFSEFEKLVAELDRARPIYFASTLETRHPDPGWTTQRYVVSVSQIREDGNVYYCAVQTAALRFAGDRPPKKAGRKFEERGLGGSLKIRCYLHAQGITPVEARVTIPRGIPVWEGEAPCLDAPIPPEEEWPDEFRSDDPPC